MPIASLVTLLSVIAALVGIRVLLFKKMKLPVEQPALPVETPSQDVVETTRTTYWPVVILLCIVVSSVVSLMLFGRVIAGG